MNARGVFKASWLPFLKPLHLKRPTLPLAHAFYCSRQSSYGSQKSSTPTTNKAGQATRIASAQGFLSASQRTGAVEKSPSSTHVSSKAPVSVLRPQRSSQRLPSAAYRSTVVAKRGSDGLISDERHKVLQHQLWPGDSQVLLLPWGGIISYARFGRAREEGPMIVGEHGTPGCRYCPQHLHTYAERHRIRLLWIDRPGYGYSTLKKGRSIEDHTKDVEYLLDFLDVQEFTQIGFSGGGPYVLAAAKFFPPTRLRKSVIMCGATHPDYEQTSVRVYWRFKQMIVRYIPFAVKFLYNYSLNHHLKKSIKAANGNKELIKRAYLVRIETFRQDLAGYRNDFKLLGRDWGFKLEDINSGPIRWYHGNLDTNTSSSAARLTAKLVNNKRGNLEYREYAGLDHFSLQTEKYKEAMEWLQKRE